MARRLSPNRFPQLVCVCFAMLLAGTLYALPQQNPEQQENSPQQSPDKNQTQDTQQPPAKDQARASRGPLVSRRAGMRWSGSAIRDVYFGGLVTPYANLNFANVRG